MRLRDHLSFDRLFGALQRLSGSSQCQPALQHHDCSAYIPVLLTTPNAKKGNGDPAQGLGMF